MFGKFLKIILLIFLLVLITAFVVYKIPNKYQAAQISYPVTEKVSWAERKLSELTLEQKIGQLFIIGFEGTSLTPGVENLIKEIHPGGILLLKRNIENENQLKELISALQEIALEDSGLPLFIAVDQEGGIISRIDWVERTPQTEIENAEQAYQIGLNRGKGLKELGINLNLAPLLDYSPAAPHYEDFIFERTFQKSPEVIGELAKALIQGQKEEGILVAIKHFPGYGGIPFNPEEKLATLEKAPEISQFQKTVEVSPEMIMISNAVYEEVEEELPFSFSEKGIQSLKNKIKGDYLIISDDLAQNSLLNKFSLREIVASPIIAGVDIMIFSGWRTPVIGGIVAFRQAVEEGKVSEQIINQSALKIIELKKPLNEPQL